MDILNLGLCQTPVGHVRKAAGSVCLTSGRDWARAKASGVTRAHVFMSMSLWCDDMLVGTPVLRGWGDMRDQRSGW